MKPKRYIGISTIAERKRWPKLAGVKPLQLQPICGDDYPPLIGNEEAPCVVTHGEVQADREAGLEYPVIRPKGFK